MGHLKMPPIREYSRQTGLGKHLNDSCHFKPLYPKKKLKPSKDGHRLSPASPSDRKGSRGSAGVNRWRSVPRNRPLLARRSTTRNPLRRSPALLRRTPCGNVRHIVMTDAGLGGCASPTTNCRAGSIAIDPITTSGGRLTLVSYGATIENERSGTSTSKSATAAAAGGSMHCRA